ncbi:MAG: hypothetical protein ACRD0P_15865, partial [Stackebrandtia sp.]
MTHDLLAAHNERLRVLDRLLARAAPPADPEVKDVPLARPGGVGVARLRHNKADSFNALWSAREVHSLEARVAGPAALAELLDDWEQRLTATATPDREDSQAVVS